MRVREDGRAAAQSKCEFRLHSCRYTTSRFFALFRRIVELARAWDRVVEAMRIDVVSRHAMWRAWRVWSLGASLAALTAGAPTPAPPVHDDDDDGAGAC